MFKPLGVYNNVIDELQLLLKSDVLKVLAIEILSTDICSNI